MQTQQNSQDTSTLVSDFEPVFECSSTVSQKLNLDGMAEKCQEMPSGSVQQNASSWMDEFYVNATQLLTILHSSRLMHRTVKLY